MDAAVERAAQVEREAAVRAQEVKRQAERESQKMLEEAFTRAWRILDGIDLLENGVGDMIGALRLEMEGFAADLGSASPADDRDGPAASSAAEENGADSTHGGPPMADAPPRSSGIQRIAQPDGDHVEVENMIIEQVAILFREGRSRADAEHLVMRFKQGGDYLHVVDRIYEENGEAPSSLGSPSPPSRRIRRGFRLRRG